ncbi:hypothetical protein [Staphylococcus argenteus]|uniref:hypothetical protein n=1 Tax=Staphylococcus argenteus TaxID=985002 RepID=UPI000919F96D|nr:hypothetical protein [Staphylococcus argenteus]MDR7649514.1 hypothetical protein [Staphylococcus argenteus]MDR7682761.1 hypothetical protein [Staphylococcus argenteus]SGW89673.1 Uncharacterised protein [Staphylococcus argenteus]SGX51657.1 Uncharacterised protein [Staphylococcus argenteus]SHD25163.1 Uncharacterised protein [Staphylococcus argenteus]
MYLKIIFHFTAAIVISVILLWITKLFDMLNAQTHLEDLLLNLDFLMAPENTPFILELMCHLIIGIVIYIIFVLLFHFFKIFYYWSYVLLFFIFITLYPFLIFIAQRPMFQFNSIEFIGWIISHICFMLLMMFSISRIK